ncbi:hypothetical protein LSTR_LSTR009944 [Laodelphax striatellus]|uniref:Uncharacterized protein n=1 Tax=Laodelphax striatellus TaxID=195883 RepID=A0A482XH87_LAOST|nr:hypothetical protein LSTR_LSTR009944 [Laodelphax striatellus]
MTGSMRLGHLQLTLKTKTFATISGVFFWKVTLQKEFLQGDLPKVNWSVVHGVPKKDKPLSTFCQLNMEKRFFARKHVSQNFGKLTTR